MGRYTSPDQVANETLGVHNGVPVYVRDVAEVKLDDSAFAQRIALLASGIVLVLTYLAFKKEASRARLPMMLAILLGAFFVFSQGTEWVALIAEGLTLTSSTYGSFFYLKQQPEGDVQLTDDIDEFRFGIGFNFDFEPLHF